MIIGIFKWWYLQDSNRGHTDFQSDALPTELRHHAICGCKGNTFLGNYKITCNFFYKFLLIIFIRTLATPLLSTESVTFGAAARTDGFEFPIA